MKFQLHMLINNIIMVQKFQTFCGFKVPFFLPSIIVNSDSVNQLQYYKVNASSVIGHWHPRSESRTMLLSWAPSQQTVAQSDKSYLGYKWSLVLHLLS